jgi:hypothetical protein
MNDRASSTDNLIDLSEMTPDHIRRAMEWLGYELPGQISPADTAAAMALLHQLPPDALAVALNPGMQVEFSNPLPMPAASPLFFPVNGGLTATATGEVSLSGVQVGPGFEPQHTFEASVELTGGWSAGAGRTELNRIARGLDKYGPESLRFPDATIEGWERMPDPLRGPNWLKGSYNYESFEGGRLSYEAVVPPSVAARIDAGDQSAIPNPLRPMEMPVGSSVIIRGDELEGSTHAFSFKLLRVVETTTELEGVAFGVTRVSDSVFELTTGPTAAVEHDRYYGIGIAAANVGIGTSERYDGGSLNVVQVDITTPEGQSAYQSFMQSGTVPDAMGPGVVDVSARIEIGGEASSSLQANVLGGTIGGAATTDFDKTLTTLSNGTSEQRATLVGTSNRVGFEIVEQFDTNEQPVPGSREWTVLLEGGMSAGAAASLKAAYSGQGYDPNMTDGAFAELRFSDEELMQLRDTARESLRAEQPETYAYIESNRNVEGLGNRLNDSHDITQRLAAANTPEEVFEFGFMNANASPERIAEGLRELSMPPTGQTGADTPPPGTLEIRDAQLDPLFPQPSAESINPVADVPVADPVPENGSWPVVLEDLQASHAAYLQSAFSGQPYDANMPDGTRAELRFSDEELMQLRDTARESLRTEQPEIYADIESNRNAEVLTDRVSDGRDMTQRLAAANTPQEVYAFGFMNPNASPTQVAETLSSLSMTSPGQTGTDKPLAGSLEIRDAALNLVFSETSASSTAPLAVAPTASDTALIDGANPAISPLPSERTVDPALLGDRDRTNFMRATESVGQLDLPPAFADDLSRQRIAASATAHACDRSMHIDHLLLSSGNGSVAQGENVLLVEGSLQSPACRVEPLKTAAAATTPVDESIARIERPPPQSQAVETAVAAQVIPQDREPAVVVRR